jgi:hypothetical protein
MGEWTQPRKYVADWPGAWVTLPHWPIANTKLLHLTQGALSETQSPSAEIAISSPQTLGFTASYQCAYGLGPELADDQRSDDAQSLCFDTATLEAPIAIAGEPFVDLDISCDRPQAILAIRLCDVAEDGVSLRLSCGLLNLTHRNGSAQPSPLEPGTPYRVRVPLCAMAHRIQPGHRLRLVISTTYWPIAWPSPETPTVRVELANSHLTLPILSPSQEMPSTQFPEPEGAPPAAIVSLRPRRGDIPQDRLTTGPTGETILSRDRDRGAWQTTDTNIAYDATGTLTFSIHPTDPLTAKQAFQLSTSLGRKDWQTRTEAWSELTCTAETFILHARIEAFEGQQRVFERSWHQTFPRDNM